MNTSESIAEIAPDLVKAIGQVKPFSGDGFHDWFSKKIEQAGLPERCTPHGLRVAGCEELAESGVSAAGLMALAGFETMSVAQGYIDKADKKKMAEEAAEKRKMANPNLRDG